MRHLLNHLVNIIDHLILGVLAERGIVKDI